MFIFEDVLALFGVVCDDLAFVLRLGFSCVTPVCSPILSLVLRLLSWQLLVFLCHCIIRNASYDCLAGRRCFGASICAAFSPSREGQVLEVASTCGEIGVEGRSPCSFAGAWYLQGCVRIKVLWRDCCQ